MSHPHTTNIALVGYGGIGKVHAFAYRALPLFYRQVPLIPKLTWVAVRRRESGILAQEEMGFSHLSTDYAEAVSAADVDIVDCCTPNHLHAPVILAALAAGKHVYCEKPLAMNVDEAQTMLRAAEQAGVMHQVAFNYRFVPAVWRAKQLLEAGRLGEIYGFRFLYLHSGYTDRARPLSWRLQKESAGSGSLGDLGSHVIDMSRYLLGEYAAVSATLRTYISTRPLPDAPHLSGVVDVDDMFLCQARLTSGAIGTIEASRMATGSNDDLRFEIHGSLGALRFNLMEPNWLEFYDATKPGEPLGGERGFTRIEAAGRYPEPSCFPSARAPVGWLRFHIASQYDLLCRVAGQKAHGATFADALRVQEIMAAIEASSQTGTWVTLPATT